MAPSADCQSIKKQNLSGNSRQFFLWKKCESLDKNLFLIFSKPNFVNIFSIIEVMHHFTADEDYHFVPVYPFCVLEMFKKKWNGALQSS